MSCFARIASLLAALLLTGVLSGALSGAPPALAGAWTQAPGETQLIATAGLRGSPLSPEEEGGGEGGVAQLYVEHGLAEGFTVGGKLLGDFVPGEPEDGSAGFGLFARQRLWSSDHAVASAQLDLRLPAERLFGEEFAASKPFSTIEVALRGLWGRSWWGDWGSAFLSTEAGYAWRSEGRDGQVLLDATVGAEPWSCCLLMLGSFARLPLGDDEASLKVQPSVAWHLGREPGERPRTSLQLGVTYDLLDTEDGPGPFVGIWRRF